MTWLFYLLSTLLLFWAFLAMGLVVYSIWVAMKRTRRAAMRAQLREFFQAFVAEAGGPQQVHSDRLADAFQQVAGKNRVALRDTIVECSERLDGDSLKPLS